MQIRGAEQQFNRADNAVAAEVFAEAPQVSLQAKGESLGTPLAIIAEPDLTSSASSQVATVQVAPTAASTTRAAPNAANLQAPVSRQAPTAPSAAAMLDFWWQQASAQEQQAFIDKVTINSKRAN
ncbi:DUF2057 family protein [Pseudoalteromonas arctica]|uniref:DUF2057 family protein n=1 Tax=Pseudoalteromonas arctica TaxID=394751 RepID=A0A7Y0DW90_9GAMM|nr:DUF2057 family protein [Pseudoalteromonas arctica]